MNLVFCFQLQNWQVENVSRYYDFQCWKMCSVGGQFAYFNIRIPSRRKKKMLSVSYNTKYFFPKGKFITWYFFLPVKVHCWNALNSLGENDTHEPL